jgi:hypothetical protein
MCRPQAFRKRNMVGIRDDFGNHIDIGCAANGRGGFACTDRDSIQGEASVTCAEH